MPDTCEKVRRSNQSNRPGEANEGYVSLVARKVLAAALLAATALSSTAASAETMFGALAKAYQFNSTLNYNRAGVRVTDEDVPIAKSGWRPTIAGAGSIDYTSTKESNRLTTGSFGVQINQMLFDGFQTTQQRRGGRGAGAGVVREPAQSPNRTRCSMRPAPTWT